MSVIPLTSIVKAKPGPKLLSDKEHEVFCRIAQGETYEEIAGAMGWTGYRSVDYHVCKVRKRFGCKSMPQTLGVLISRGLLS